MAGRFLAALTRGVATGVSCWLFPDHCRVCGGELIELSRIPVCASCLTSVQPLQADYICHQCGTPFSTARPLDETGRCALCRAGLIAYDAAYAYGYYEGVLQQLIHLFKYERVLPLGKVLARWMLAALPRQLTIDLIVPVPMHWWRRWRRGFNQAHVLARHLARATGIRLEKALRRRRLGMPQAGLRAADRRRNVAGAFSVPHPHRVKGQRVLLVDDVLTTGATAGACARELKRAGARSVVVLTVARADRRIWPIALPGAASQQLVSEVV